MPKTKDKQNKIDLSGYKITDEDKFFKLVRSRLSIAKKAHKLHTEEWDRFIRMYRQGSSRNLNVQKADRGHDKRQKMIANYVFNNIQSILSATHDKRAEINLLPRGKDDEGENTDKTQALIDYDFDKQLLYEKTNSYVYPDSLLTGQGYVKIFWDLDTEKEEKTRKVLKEKTKGFIRKRKVTEEAEETYEEERPTKDDAEITVINPYRLFKTPDGDNIKEVSWVFEEIPMEKDKADAEFKQEFEADYEVETYKDWRAEDENIVEDDTKRVRIYEGWGEVMGKDGKMKKVKVEFTDKKLLTVEDNPFDHQENPYEELINYIDFHSPYGISEVKYIEQLQNELDRTRKVISEHNKKMVNPQRRVEQGAVDNKGLEQLRDPRSGVVVEVKPGKMGAIQDIMPGQLGADIYNYDGILRDDMARATGINEYESGGNERQVESATGIAVMSEATQRRIREKVRRLERFYEAVAKKLIALYKQYGDRERVVRITGDPTKKWEEFTPQDVIGEYDYIAEAGSTMPINKEARAARWLKIYQTFGDNEFINKYELTREALKESGEIKDVDKYMTEPETSPEEAGEVTAPPSMGAAGLPGMGQDPMMGNMAPPVQGQNLGGMMPGAGVPMPPM